MSIKLNHWIRKSQTNADGKIPVFLNINHNGIKCQVTTGIYIKESQWNKKAQRVKGNTIEIEAFNEKLTILKARSLKIYNEMLLGGEPFNAHSIKDVLINGTAKPVTLNEMFDQQIQKMEALKGIGYSLSTITKYKHSQSRINEYLRSKLKKKEIYLYELNFKFIDDFSTFLKIKYNNSNTTIYKSYQRIGKVVRTAMSHGYIDRYPFDGFRIKLDKTPLVYLTLEEVQLIENKTFSITRLEITRNLFLLACYSGLTFKEMQNLKPAHVIEQNGNYWLTMIRQKTKRTYRIVLLPRAYELIQLLYGYKDHLKPNRLLPIVSNQNYNGYLKEVGNLCGIHKTLTSHVGRKTFSIGISLRSGVSINLLSALLGHSNIKVTMDYYAKITDEIMIEGVDNLSNELKRLESGIKH